MKTDYRIVGRPYRGARRVMHMITGIASRQEAEAKMEEGIEGGWIDPYAYVRAQKVCDDFVGRDYTAKIRAKIQDKSQVYDSGDTISGGAYDGFVVVGVSRGWYTVYHPSNGRDATTKIRWNWV